MSSADAMGALLIVVFGLTGFVIGLAVGWTKAFHDHAEIIDRVYDGQRREYERKDGGA